MAIGAVELKRLGMVRKPVIVVPNHMLEQFSREFLQLYPQARVLAAGSDQLSKDNRRRFVARVASNDWDAVVMTRSAFERIPVSVRGRQALPRAGDRQAPHLSHAREGGPQQPDGQADREGGPLDTSRRSRSCSTPTRIRGSASRRPGSTT